MASQGASLQSYNTELVKCLEDLREKREILNKTIVAEEKKKADIQRKLEKLTSQLSRVNESLSQKAAARNEYDVTIQETEAAFMKILESSQTLLHVLKRESVSLVKKRPVTGGGSSSHGGSHGGSHGSSASAAPLAHSAHSAHSPHSPDHYQQQYQQQQPQSHGYASASSGSGGGGGYAAATRTQ